MAKSFLHNSYQYNNPSEALQAYIFDYEGKERKYYGKKLKHDKELMDLLCASCGNSVSNWGQTSMGFKAKPVQTHHNDVTMPGFKTIPKSELSSSDILHRKYLDVGYPISNTKAATLPRQIKHDVSNSFRSSNPSRTDHSHLGFSNDLLSKARSEDSVITLNSNSSILTGHMLKGEITGKRTGLDNKVASTPKKGLMKSGEIVNGKMTSPGKNTPKKQIRFECDSKNINRSNTLRSDDLSEILPAMEPLATVSKHISSSNASSKFNLSNSTSNKKLGSCASFTTDDLLDSDPSGFSLLQKSGTSSKGLPRPFSYPQLLNEHSKINLNSSASLLYQEISRNNASYSSNVLNYEVAKDLERSQKQLDRIASILPPVNSSTLNESINSQKESKYKNFLQTLIKEIDDSESSVAGAGKEAMFEVYGGVGRETVDRHATSLLSTTPQNFYVHQQLSEVGGNKENHFLGRIQSLLASEAIPTISQYLHPEDMHDSVGTDDILNGERPWEKTTAFPQTTIFDQFMDDCMAEAKGTSREVQPGSLESLKNMLFKVQSLSTSQDGSTLAKQSSSDSGEETPPQLPLDDSISNLLSPETKKLLSNSYSREPHLLKAMEHLTELRNLVEKKDN